MIQRNHAVNRENKYSRIFFDVSRSIHAPDTERMRDARLMPKDRVGMSS